MIKKLDSETYHYLNKLLITINFFTKIFLFIYSYTLKSPKLIIILQLELNQIQGTSS